MLISTHVLVGSTLGRLLSRRPTRLSSAGRGELIAATALGCASHFACDALPHWGNGVDSGDVRSVGFLRVAVPDGLAGLALLATLTVRETGRRQALVAACALGACLPDADKVGELMLGRSPYPVWVDRWHGAIQRESPKLLASDVAIIVVFAFILLRRTG